MFRTKVFVPLTALAVIKYIFLALGIALLVTVVGLVAYSRYQVSSACSMNLVIHLHSSSTSEITQYWWFQLL